MALWIVFAVMTALAALAVLAPLVRRSAVAPEGSDVRVYRDQLTEVERDLDRGLIAPGEAEAARTEIARRLLKAARTGETAAQGGPAGRRALAAVALLVLPALAVTVYLRVGAPELPDQPLGPRLTAAPEKQSIDALIARVEAHLAQKPNDGEGWEVLAPVYMRVGRSADAARAFGEAIRLLGPTARREFGLGQALATVAGGVVTAEARAAFERSAALEPDVAGPRLYLALALSQEGRHAEAAVAWRRLVTEAKGDEGWLASARRELADAEKAAGIAPTAPGPAAPAPSAPPAAVATPPSTAPVATAQPGPSADDVAAAAALSSEDRAKMIEGMVARLSDRLKASGGSAEDWGRLIRSLSMLGRKDEARAAAIEAREALKASEADRAHIEEVSKGLGIEL